MERRELFKMLGAAGAAPVVSRIQLPSAKPKPVSAAPNGNIIFACMGDSITEGLFGSTGENGYRAKFRDNIYGPNEMHNIQFVGNRQTGSAGLWHFGWGGKTLQFFIDGVNAGWLDNPGPANAGPPQILIFQCGANDFGAQGGYQSADQVLANTAIFLDLVHAKYPSMIVVLTDQIQCSGTVSHVFTQNSIKQGKYNKGLPNLVSIRPWVLLSKHSVITQNNLSDGIHPNDRGYEMMAYLTYYACKPLLAQDGDNMANISCPFDRVPTEIL